MANDWLGELSPEERAGWDEFVDHFRRDALGKIMQSDHFVSILSHNGWDVKFAVELGAAVMLDKPIMAVVHPDTQIPEKLRAIADEIVVADIDTEAGRNAIAQAVRRHAERELTYRMKALEGDENDVD